MRWGRIAAGVVLFVAALNWVGWATGTEQLTRGLPSSPQMPSWTAVLLAAVAVAVLVQSGRPSPTRVWIGCGLATAAGVLAAVFLAECATGTSLGLDPAWFPEAARTLPDIWPGSRPSPTASPPVLLVSIAVAVMRLDRRWTRLVWSVCLPAAAVIPLVVVLAEVFGVEPLMGQAILSAVGVLLLIAAAWATRPERNPVAWLLTRPDRSTLLQMAAILAGLPMLVGLSRRVLLAMGVSSEVERVVSLAVGTVVVGGVAFYFFQREQRLLIEKDQRAQAEKRYRILADNAVDVVSHIHGTEVLWVSPSVEAAFGWPPEQWIGTDISPRIHPDDLDTVTAALQQTTADNSAGARCRVYTSDGGYRWVEFRATPYLDAEGNAQGVIVAARIVDEQVAVEQQLKADKARFEAVVANAPSAISVQDLAHRYTLVNDTFCRLFEQNSAANVLGRTEDEILSPDALKRSQRAAARLAAGESSMEEEKIERGAETIAVMTHRFPLRNAAGAIAELVTIRTDNTYRKILEHEATQRTLWEERIWSAIGEGRLLAYSQPIVDIATGVPVAEELLVRLRVAETEEILSPAEFLPQCEKYGLIPVIDRYMIGRALDLAHTGAHVCVNITGQTMGDPTAMGEILDALTTAGPEVADKITFEITESIALASPAVAKKFSAGMRELGCRVALDDFGTGYGTFTELRHLHLDTLKIDLSFVQQMLQDRDDERVVKTIVAVAQAYDLTTVAEGVETQALLERLAELGADRAQGYLFGKPQPINW